MNLKSNFTLPLILLLLIGHFLPWAQHKTAALTLHGHDLATFTHFTPGAGVFLNEWFYLPLWAAALMLALWAATSVANNGWRWVIGGAALGIASLGFPTYPEVLAAYRAPNPGGVDYRLQFYISLTVMLLVLALLLGGRKLPPRVQWVAHIILALLPIISLVGYIVIRPFIAELYNDVIGIGSGWWLTLAAVVMIGVSHGAPHGAPHPSAAQLK